MEPLAELREDLLRAARRTNPAERMLEVAAVFLEAPSAHLDRGAAVATVELPSGRTASVLSRVDVLLDRLDELQATGHLVVGQQALALLGGMPDEDATDLDARAEQRRVTKILAAVRTLADDITSGRREPPDTAEMHEIARTALRAEYAPRSP